MCGIAGIFSLRSGSVPRDTVGRMVSAISHRGPDDSGVCIQQGIGLGHRRLSIIDLAGGAQPMQNDDGSLVITFNGEIFNYLELREELIKKGHRFLTRSDTEVLLHLYQEEGDRFVSRLNGQWAFALWDRCKQRLFLSRDRVGVRPLFYAFADGDFVFGSEVKALFTHPGISRELDLRALDQLFTFWSIVPPRTAFRAVSELPPGHSMVVDTHGAKAERYWQLSYDAPTTTAVYDSGQDQADALRELLEAATSIRLRSDVPVAAYLSGGLDSSVTAALTARHSPRRLTTFSVAFDDSAFDEREYQRALVRHLDTEHHELLCSDKDIAAALPEVVWHAETPLLRTAPVPLFLLSKMVRQHGFKVVVTGEGADEVLGGYDIFKELKVRDFIERRPDSQFRPLLLRRLYPYIGHLQKIPAKYLDAFFRPNTVACEWPLLRSHAARYELTSALKSFFSADVKSELSNYCAYLDLTAGLPENFQRWDSFSRAQYLESAYLLPGYILSAQGDRMAMAHAVEGRYPFLDVNVIEFAGRLPASLKMKVLEEKYLLKSMSKGLIPESIRRRKKQPYRAPAATSMLLSKSTTGASDFLCAESIRSFGIFEPRAVDGFAAKIRSGRANGARDDMAIVGLLTTQLLVQQFTNNRSFHREQSYEFA